MVELLAKLSRKLKYRPESQRGRSPKNPNISSKVPDREEHSILMGRRHQIHKVNLTKV